MRQIEGRSYEIEGRSYNVWAGVEVGQVVAVAPRFGHTVLLTNCTSCGVQRLTIHGSSDMAMVEYGGGGANHWRGNRVVRNGNRHMATLTPPARARTRCPQSPAARRPHE